MTKSKYYRHGKFTGRTYLKEVGHGFETGFVWDSKTVFVGNFIHAREANVWYALMNRELRQFSRKYAVGERYPTAWYGQFIRNHLYKCYYAFVDRALTRHWRDYERLAHKDVQRYQRIRREHPRTKLKPFLKVA